MAQQQPQNENFVRKTESVNEKQQQQQQQNVPQPHKP